MLSKLNPPVSNQDLACRCGSVAEIGTTWRGAFRITCPHCNLTGNDFWDIWEAIESWKARGNKVCIKLNSLKTVDCPRCNRSDQTQLATKGGRGCQIYCAACRIWGPVRLNASKAIAAWRAFFPAHAPDPIEERFLQLGGVTTMNKVSRLCECGGTAKLKKVMGGKYYVICTDCLLNTDICTTRQSAVFHWEKGRCNTSTTGLPENDLPKPILKDEVIEQSSVLSKGEIKAAMKQVLGNPDNYLGEEHSQHIIFAKSIEQSVIDRLVTTYSEWLMTFGAPCERCPAFISCQNRKDRGTSDCCADELRAFFTGDE